MGVDRPDRTCDEVVWCCNMKIKPIHRFVDYSYGKLVGKGLQGGPLQVINRVITPINGLING